MNTDRPRPHNSACICAGCQAVRRERSPRSVNLYGLTDASAVQDADIRKRWHAIGGVFHGPNVETATITEARLFAAVRAGRIRL